MFCDTKKKKINAPSFCYFTSLEYLHPKKTILMDFSLFLNVIYFNCFLWKKYQYISMHNLDATNPYIGNIGEEKDLGNISVLSFSWLPHKVLNQYKNSNYVLIC